MRIAGGHTFTSVGRATSALGNPGEDRSVCGRVTVAITVAIDLAPLQY